MPIVTDFADIKRRMDALSNPEPTLTIADVAEQIEAMMRSMMVRTAAAMVEFDANAAKINARLADMETRFPSHWVGHDS